MITVLTPTFNRADKLSNLYQSLCGQTAKDFEWLVVDDGSTDDTKEKINDLRQTADFPIRYLYKENGGKHTALNAGIAVIENELTFIVDSDDIITEDAITTIISYYNRYKENSRLCGYAYLRCFPDGKINGSLFAPDEKIAYYIETRINSGDLNADKAEVFYTRCLKEFPFPEYPGERFLGEDIVWIRMSLKYQMVHINRAIYIGDYLTDGLTENRRKHNLAAPVGCMNRAEEYMRKELKLIYRFKGAVQFIVYGKFAGFRSLSLLKRAKHKALVLIAYLPAMLLYLKWRSVKNDSKP